MLTVVPQANSRLINGFDAAVVKHILSMLPLNNQADAEDFINFYTVVYQAALTNAPEADNRVAPPTERIRYAQARALAQRASHTAFINMNRFRVFYGNPRVNPQPTPFSEITGRTFYLARGLGHNLAEWSLVVAMLQIPYGSLETELHSYRIRGFPFLSFRVLSTRARRDPYRNPIPPIFSWLQASSPAEGLSVLNAHNSNLGFLGFEMEPGGPRSRPTPTSCEFYAISNLAEPIKNYYYQRAQINSASPLPQTSPSRPRDLATFVHFLQEVLAPNCRGFFPDLPRGPRDPDDDHGGQGPLGGGAVGNLLSH